MGFRWSREDDLWTQIFRSHGCVGIIRHGNRRYCGYIEIVFTCEFCKNSQKITGCTTFRCFNCILQSAHLGGHMQVKLRSGRVLWELIFIFTALLIPNPMIIFGIAGTSREHWFPIEHKIQGWGPFSGMEVNFSSNTWNSPHFHRRGSVQGADARVWKIQSSASAEAESRRDALTSFCRNVSNVSCSLFVVCI